MNQERYKYRVSVIFKDGTKQNGRATKSKEVASKRKLSSLNDSTIKQAWIEYADHGKKNWDPVN